MKSYVVKFGSDSFKGALTGVKSSFPKNEVGSIYADQSSKNFCNVSGNVYEAFKLYNGHGERNVFLGQTPTGYVVELDTTDGTVCQLVKMDKVGGIWQITAGTVDNTAGISSLQANYKLFDKRKYPTGFSGTAILLALMPSILENEEASQRAYALNPFTEHADDDIAYWNQITNGVAENLENAGKAIAAFTDNVYRRMNLDLTDVACIPVPENSDIDVKPAGRNMVKTKIKKEIVGTPRYFTPPVKLTSSTSDYDLDAKATYTEEEKKLIPVMPASYRMPEWVGRTCKYIKKSSKYEEPIRTAFLVGPSGCGKTLGSVAMASLLGLVHDHVTCQPDMEIFDFLGQIFPNTNPAQRVSFNDVRTALSLPSVEDIMMDKESAYIQMYKEPMPANVEEADMICAMVNMVNAEMAEMAKGKDYTYVEGGLTKAIRNGYLFEVQEIGIVKRPGVAVGLNALLEAGSEAFITLPTGESVQKNKNCVIVFTSNDEYEGTVNLNQSVLSRMGHVEYFKNASRDEMVSRTLAKVPDFYDKELLKEMAEIVEKITEFCKEKGIEDGVCGQRELNNWAMEIMIDLEDYGLDEASPEIIRETCQHTVLNKVAQNVEDILDVAQGIVDPKYGVFDVRC